MEINNLMWECNCGHIEYGQAPPEECEKCWEANNFAQVPEDKVKDKAEEKVVESKIDKDNIDNEDDEDEG